MPPETDDFVVFANHVTQDLIRESGEPAPLEDVVNALMQVVARCTSRYPGFCQFKVQLRQIGMFPSPYPCSLFTRPFPLSVLATCLPRVKVSPAWYFAVF